jgi:hypothetical protein
VYVVVIIPSKSSASVLSWICRSCLVGYHYLNGTSSVSIYKKLLFVGNGKSGTRSNGLDCFASQHHKDKKYLLIKCLSHPHGMIQVVGSVATSIGLMQLSSYINT